MFRRAVASRRVGWFLLIVLALAGIAWTLGRSAVVFNFATFRPTARLAYSEMVAVMAAVAGAVVMKPRMWHFERTATARASVVAGGTALVGVVAPCIVVVAGMTRIPVADRASWQVTNALVLAAAVFVLAALIGPALGGGLVVLAYFAHAIVVNAWTDLALVPLALIPEGDRTAHAHWTAATVLALLAVAVNARTHGLSAFGERLFDRDY
jgi:hypothetical protein